MKRTKQVGKSFKNQIGDAILSIRRDAEGFINSMPSIAKNQAQQELVKKHGTPREFARACVMAIGEISCSEAFFAVSKYHKQWKDAK